MLPEDVRMLLEVVGLRPVVVEALGSDVLTLNRFGLVLLDAEVVRTRLDEAMDAILASAAAGLRV